MSALYPFDIDLLPPMFHSFDSPILLRAIISARTELAELKGYISGISRPNLFFSLITQEAVASLVIDNIHTTVESVLQQDLLPDDKQDIASRNALYYISIIKSGSIRPVEFYLSSYGIRNMHANISSESDSFREYGNYVETPPVGKPFWSPSYKQVPYLVKDWEKFVNNPCSVVDSLVKCILSYYQLEAIHPFEDDCGQISRMTLMIHLVREKIITHPILLVSNYIKDNHTEYYRLMRAVTTDNKWDDFILFMLRGFELQARATREKLFNILNLYHELLNKSNNLSHNTNALMEHIFTFPVTSSEKAAEDLKIDVELASKYLDELSNTGILERNATISHNFYFNRALLNIIN